MSETFPKIIIIKNNDFFLEADNKVKIAVLKPEHAIQNRMKSSKYITDDLTLETPNMNIHTTDHHNTITVKAYKGHVDLAGMAYI